MVSRIFPKGHLFNSLSTVFVFVMFAGQSKSLSNVLLPQRSKKQREKTEFTNNVSELCELINLLPSLESEIHSDQSNARASNSENEALALREFAATCERCNRLIAELQREVSATQRDTQLHVHREAIVESLQTRYKHLCTVYNANANAKLKKLTQQHDFSKLGSSRAFSKRLPTTGENASSRKRNSDSDSMSSSFNSFLDSSRNKRDRNSSTATKREPAAPSWYAEANVVSEEEAARFENEFTMMYDERVSKMNEIRTVETQLSDIQRLQDMLAEHVLEQEEKIDATHGNVIAATDNIKQGNEHLHRAMQNTAKMRIWILFVLLVCTFTLLFLHWYND